MSYEIWRSILLPFGIALFWLLIVAPIKYALYKIIHDSRVKRFLFRER